MVVDVYTIYIAKVIADSRKLTEVIPDFGDDFDVAHHFFFV
jgi:hypothetical protein